MVRSARAKERKMAVNILVARSYVGVHKVDLHTSAVFWCKMSRFWKKVRNPFS